MTDLRKLAEAATPLNLASAQKISCGEIECPTCGGEGFVDGKDFLNIDGVAVGVQVYGIGTEMVAAENYYAAANPSAILALLDEKDALTARVAELTERNQWLDSARKELIEYSCDLQRIIEDLCARRDIRKPKTSARYHYDMAVKFSSAAAAMEGK